MAEEKPQPKVEDKKIVEQPKKSEVSPSPKTATSLSPKTATSPSTTSKPKAETPKTKSMLKVEKNSSAKSLKPAVQSGKPVVKSTPQLDQQKTTSSDNKSGAVEKTETPGDKKTETSKEASKETPEKTEDKKKEDKDKKEKKPEKKKKDEKPKVKKYEAVVNGSAMHMSRKQAAYICSFIKGKEIDDAIADLRQVILLKKVVPFKGEIPHRKGKGMMSGRYPVKASGLFIDLLKALKGNVIVNGLEIDNTRIAIASASQAARPMRSGGRLGKRTHVTLKAKEFKQKTKEINLDQNSKQKAKEEKK